RREGRTAHGRLVRVVDVGAGRVEAPCPIVERCGGCPWMHVSLDAQRDAKRRFLASVLPRDATREGLEVSIVAAGPAVGYRRRARLAFECDDRERRLGFRSRRSNELVDVEACLVLARPLADALSHVRETLLPVLAGRGEIHLAIGAHGRAVVAI